MPWAPSRSHLFNRIARASYGPDTVLGKAVRGGRGGGQMGLTRDLGVRGPRLWKQQRRVFWGVLCLEVEQARCVRRQWGAEPGDSALSWQWQRPCCLNSNEQPVVMATTFLVQSLILVVCLPRSHLTPISAVSHHVTPNHPFRGAGGTSAGDRRGTRPCGQRQAQRGPCGEMTSPPVMSRGQSAAPCIALHVTRGQGIRKCFFLWPQQLRSESLSAQGS